MAMDAFADAGFITELRRQLVGFATLQLGDVQLAEDTVQECLLGAMRNSRSFGARAALRTWVFAILKNKIADALRQRSRTIEASQLLKSDEADEDFHALFDERGHWNSDDAPSSWGNPEGCLQDRQFWRVFDLCLQELPAQQARAFMMREFVEMDTAEVASALDVTVGTLNVMLHRARMRLRVCLSKNWFDAGSAGC